MTDPKPKPGNLLLNASEARGQMTSLVTKDRSNLAVTVLAAEDCPIAIRAERCPLGRTAVEFRPGYTGHPSRQSRRPV